MTDLLVGLAFTIGTFFILMLLYFVYYFQDRRTGIRAELFRQTIIINAILIISELISSYLLYDELSPLLGRILLKFHWYTGIAYFYFFYFHLCTHIENISECNMKELLWKRKNGKIITIITVIFSIAFIVLPFGELDYHALSYLPGLPAYTVFAYVVVIVMIVFIKYLKKKNKTKKELFFILLFVLVPIVDLILQLLWLNVAFSPTLMAFLLLGCYFLLENPDLYVANELEESKKTLEFLSSHKKNVIKQKGINISNNLFNISQTYYNIINNNDIELSKSTINNNIELLKDMVNEMQNLINMLYIEENNTTLDEYEYSTTALLTKLYNYAIKKIGNKNIKVTLDVDQFLPIKLYGNEYIVYQALLNSIDCAVNNTLAGNIIITIKCSFFNNQAILNIDITDTGNGMAEEYVRRINNDEISTEDIQAIERYSISKKFVSYLKGTYKVTSSIGVGTTISISFGQKVANQTNTGEFKPIEIDYNVDLSNRKILIIDNNPNALINMLNKYKANYEYAKSIDDCINKIKTDNTITTIFINPSLADDNIANAIKSIMSPHQVPNKIIAVSANSSTHNKSKYLSKGYDYYINKPFNRYDFNEIIKNI